MKTVAQHKQEIEAAALAFDAADAELTAAQSGGASDAEIDRSLAAIDARRAAKRRLERAQAAFGKYIRHLRAELAALSA